MGNSVAKENTTKENTTLKETLTAKEPKKSTFQRLLARFQPEKWSSKTKKETTTIPPPKPPLRNQNSKMDSSQNISNDKMNNSEWTEVPLKAVDDSPQLVTKVKEIKGAKGTPIPPPRKHKMRLHELLESPKEANELQGEAAPVLVPVEEEIIVPKKVIEHVCDGTHKHVKNVINGKVIDQIVQIKAAEQSTNSNAKRKKSETINKNASTLSLPLCEDLKKKEDRKNGPTKPSKKKSSASSLPTDKKPSKPHTAVEKIESYMIRCKSFGSILPTQKAEKPKPLEIESDKESEDSWGGLDDWDMGVIENDVSNEVRTPKRVKPKKPEAKPNEKPTGGLNLSDIDNFNQSFIETGKDDTLKMVFLDKPEITNTPPTSGEASSPKYPFKKTADKSVFETDAFFSSEFLRNESLMSEKNQHYKPTKMAPLASFDSDREIDKLLVSNQNVEPRKTVAFAISSESPKEFVKKPESPNVKQIEVTIEKRESLVEEKPSATPRRRSTGIGHSNLLKFIKSDMESAKLVNDINKKMPSNESHKISNKEEIETPATDEPKIVPEIKNLEASWQKLVQRDEANKLSNLLELESAISDTLASSSDTDSTTVETVVRIKT